MIVKERLKINGRTFQKTYSDAGFYIMRDGEMYEDAIDPFGYFEREYIETNIPIENIEDEEESIQE